MRPTRRSQPYRAGAREPGPALTAMLRGRTAQGHNPIDLVRRTQTLMRAARAPGRKARQPRKPRQAR
jgi:hypothetical protein